MTDAPLRGTRRRLLLALADGGFHSGQALAQRLGLSRAGVWKQLDALAESGLGLERVRGRGYRLCHPVEPLEERRIREAMGDPWDGRLSMVLLDTVASTNAHMLETPGAIGPAPSVCLAEGQVGGRGRRGRRWQSAYAGGIALSLGWRFPVLSGGVAGLAPAVAVTLADALESLGADGLGLKWPNDLVCDSGKLAGVLIELRGDPAGPCDLVIGIGLNWASPGGDLDQQVADLGAVFPGERVSRNRVIGAVLTRLCDGLVIFAEQGFAPFAAGWRERDVLAGKEVELDLGRRRETGRAMGLDEGGGLRIRDDSGTVHAWQVGEISVRPRKEVASETQA
jgi:BirA family biotin operon repressor/biotin-[acetyl-CoA-carboxylase] ligase